MTRRHPAIPPADVLFSGAQQRHAGKTEVANIKTTVYLTPEQMETIDDVRRELRRQGFRSMTSTQLVRAAVTFASRQTDKWTATALEEDD